jgi:hypothetical protein
MSEATTLVERLEALSKELAMGGMVMHDMKRLLVALEGCFEAGFWAGRGDARNVLEAWHAYTGREPPTLEQYKANARRFLAGPGKEDGHE